jgi:ABC-type phosphate/phosphonate transport system substrate-binding protein
VGEPITFAIAGGDARASAALAELCRSARDLHGIELVPRTAAGYGELGAMLATNRAQLAWAPPIVAARLVEEAGARPLAVPVRHGATTYRSAIVVRKGGPRAFEELRGRSIAWVDRESTGGHVLVRLHLSGKGLDVDTWFRSSIFAGSHAAALDAVTGGRTDAAATWCRTGPGDAVLAAAWLGASGRAQWPVVPVLFTPAVPNDLLVGGRSLTAPQQTALVRMFCSPDGRLARPLSDVFGTASLRLAADEHVTLLRRLLRSARAEHATP